MASAAFDMAAGCRQRLFAANALARLTYTKQFTLSFEWFFYACSHINFI